MRRRDFCLAAGAFASQLRTASGQSLTLAYQSVSTLAWPVFIAQESRIYTKYGLAVKPVLGGDPAWVALLVRGEAAMGIGGLQQLLPSAAKDGSLVAIGTLQNRSTLRLVARPDIATVPDLKGKRIAVSTTGDALYGFLIAVLRKFGVTPAAVDLIPVGTSGPRRAAALVGGRVDAALLTAQASFRLEEAGYRIVADLAGFEDVFTSIAYWIRKGDLTSGGGLTERLVQAHSEAIREFYADKEFAVKAHLTYDKEASAADMARAYDLMAARNVFERIPYVPKGAVAADPSSSVRADLHAAVDNSIVDRLVKQGFFVKLFGTGIKSEQETKAAQAFWG
jgi:ABC-type nitrate/sulfonate/bicarbonate transport system substrate-binding protein